MCASSHICTLEPIGLLTVFKKKRKKAGTIETTNVKRKKLEIEKNSLIMYEKIPCLKNSSKNS